MNKFEIGGNVQLGDTFELGGNVQPGDKFELGGNVQLGYYYIVQLGDKF
jgi:UDP-3-O-[3-hydroxymyristoyl] glucosamine N-acyltransferase